MSSLRIARTELPSTDGIDEVHGMSYIRISMRTHFTGFPELVLRATNDLELFGKLTYKLLQSVQNESAYDSNPIYAILHEAVYCQGQASNWSAARVMNKDSRFDWKKASANLKEQDPVYFSGEMASLLLLTSICVAG